jgi:hypothetical protein
MRTIAVLLPLLAACSRTHVTTVAPEPLEPPGPAEARLVVLRDSWRNPLKPYAFFDDQEILGFSEAGAWFEVLVRPGRHFFYLHGVEAAGVRATLAGGRTYYLRVESVPEPFRLRLRIAPLAPGTEDFDRIDELLAGLERREPVQAQLEAYVERYADRIEEGLARLRTEGIEETAALSEEDGR